MEAVPRLHMLWFALKSSPEGTSFANLKKYIAEFYQEDPEAYSKEVFALETLRNQAMHTTKDGSAVMKRYYCQLHSLQNRFPQLSERGIFSFTWKDLYQNNINEVTEMRYELAAVLFNIAASHTQTGASVTRGDVDGMKMACTHFQCAAWAFGELRERYTHVNSGNDFMCTELLVFMQQVCYAQAQECILEKSLIDNRKPNIVAKVTAQIVVYYGAALAALLTGGDDGPVAQVVDASVYKLWKKYVRFKISYLNCILYLYQGQHAEEQRKMGERVTLFQAAWDKLEEARKESKGLPDQKEINESLTFTADVVEAKRKNAKNENEFIYHESVPELTTISAVQGANLVNGISFSVSDPEVAGDDIFARLVPMKAHEASSMYSEEKAKLLRKYGAAIEERDNELASYMSSLTLDNLNINEEKANKLPQGIVDRCAALNANKSAISDLIAAMSQLAEITSDVEANLSELGSMLSKEEEEEREFQTQTGIPCTPYPHMTELTREFQKYSEAHARAGESNNTLRKAMSLHVNNLKILARPLQEIQQMMPKLSAELNTAEIFKDVKLIVNKVNEMKAQRAQFHADLRIAVNEDDITAKVIAHGTDEGLQALFERELAKHERLTQLIEQNLLAQQNILQALTESYAKAAPVLKTLADVKQKRENFFSSLAASYDVYEDLLAKSAKGLEFYKKLAGNVQKLYTRVKSARDVQSEERQQRLKSVSHAVSNVGVVQPTPKANKMHTPVSQTIYQNAVAGSSNTSSSTPKLRDYLAAKNTSAASIAAAGVGAGFKDIPPATSNAASPYIPTVRPVPVGSENPSQAACSSSGGYYNAATSNSTAPNEPPPPYSVQQQQYYDPSAAGYTNPIYQQQQQNIAPPAYKLQASPNSQFTTTAALNANMSNLSLQGNAYDNQTQYQQLQMQQQQLQNYNYLQATAAANNANNEYAANGYGYGSNAVQQYGALPATVATSSANPYTSTANVAYNYQQQQQQATAMPGTLQQTAYHAAVPAPTLNYQAGYTVSAASSVAGISTSQPLYVATMNQTELTQQQQQHQLASQYAYNANQPQPIAANANQAYAQQQAGAAMSNALPQQPQISGVQQQQQQHLLQQQTTLPAPAQPQQQLQQTISPAQQLAQPPQGSAALSITEYAAYVQSASNHPGYSFNPQTGIYEYGSGYQHANANVQQFYGQFTQSGRQQAAVVGTTDSEAANKMNIATGFDTPIISHTKVAAGASTTATPSASMESPKPATDGAQNAYYTLPYGYHSSDTTQNFNGTALTTRPTTIATVPPTVEQQHFQQQQQQQVVISEQQAKQEQQKSIYIQSGRTIANTQTTHSGAEYASTTQQAAEGELPQAATAAATLPTTQAAQPPPTASNVRIATKASSNIDLLTDIDFSGMSPPILPEPVLQPQVVSSTPSSQVAAPSTKLKDDPDKASDVSTVLQPQLPVLPPIAPVAAPSTIPTAALQLTSPTGSSPAPRKSSMDNLSNCSDLSSLENFNWDSVSVAALSANNKHSTMTTTTTQALPTTATTFQMQPHDPFTDDKTLKYFHKEVERYEKLIEGLHVKMLNGHTQLSAKWKELQDLLAKDASKRSTSLAKLFPEKNRSLDCLPYDHARVKLDRDTDDYINAAYLQNLVAGSPNFIIAQTPQQNTLNDFWSMIWSQKARTVVCLHTAKEMLDAYWPQQLEQEKHYDDFTVKCFKIDNLSHSNAYHVKLSMHGADPIIDLTVLQIKQWSKASPAQVLGIAQNALQTHQQRCWEFNTPAAPLVMNCLTGSERSELLTVALCAILATQIQRPVLLNVVDVWSRICAHRQNSIRDSATLEQSMQLVLHHAHDVLNKRGIMTSYQVKIAPQVAVKEQQESKDPLNELDPLWKLK